MQLVLLHFLSLDLGSEKIVKNKTGYILINSVDKLFLIIVKAFLQFQF